jgi:hypothetical protein
MQSEPPPIPIPVATLAYAPPPQNRRPGIMTTVGVISIVLASLSLLASVAGVFSNLAMLAMSRVPMPSVSMPSVPTPVSQSPAKVTVDGIEVDPDGSADAIPDLPRRKVEQAIDELRPMNPTRAKHLDLLLKYCGMKMFPSVTDASTVREIRGTISWQRGAYVNSPAIDYISIPTGTIQVSDRFATFRPSGKGEIVQADAGGTPITTAAPPPLPRPFPFRIDPTAATIAMAESAVSLLVAVALLIGGILLLRNSPGYLRLHWIYIIAKIPLVIVAAVASWMSSNAMMNSMASSMPPGAAAPNLGAFMIIPAVVTALITMAYPISLIFIFATRTAKAYYNDVRGVHG